MVRRTAFVVVLATLALAAVGWFWWLPEYRPRLHESESYGIDVSHHQGQIDWHRVARDHISFAFIKATEGGDHADLSFAANWRSAGAAGLRRGAYHFFTLCTPGADQAAHFLRTVPAGLGELAPAVDLELAGNCAQRPAPENVAEELATFLRVVRERTGRTVVLYLGDDFAKRYRPAAAATSPLWLRRFLRRPSRTWQIWQVSGYAHVAGVHGSVDLDIARL